MRQGTMTVSRQVYGTASDWLYLGLSEEASDPEETDLNRDEEEKAAEENQQIQTVEISDGGGMCAVCGDEFDVDFNDDTENWEYQDCVRADDLNFHPSCYQDYKNGAGLLQSQDPSTNQSEFTINGETPKLDYTIVKKEDKKTAKDIKKEKESTNEQKEPTKEHVSIKQEPTSSQEPSSSHEVPETEKPDQTEVTTSVSIKQEPTDSSEVQQDAVQTTAEEEKLPEVKQEGSPQVQVTIKQEKVQPEETSQEGEKPVNETKEGEKPDEQAAEGADKIKVEL